MCVFCGTNEDIQHVLFECDFARNIWNQVLERDEEYRWSTNGVMGVEWIISNTKGKSLKCRKAKLIVAETIYGIWTTRNMIIFQNHTKYFFQLWELKYRIEMCLGKFDCG